MNSLVAKSRIKMEDNIFPVQLPEFDEAKYDALAEADGRVYDFLGVCNHDTILK